MSVFTKYTKECLVKNKTRTLVTIIGIVLSMAMLSAVVEAAFSGITYLRRVEVASNGGYHGFFKSISRDQADALAKSDEIESFATWSSIGWMKIDSKNEAKPYILVQSISEGFEELVSVKLTEGRLPENDGEVILPSYMSSDSGTCYNVGDRVTLSLGKRMSEGYELSRYTYCYLNNVEGESEEIVDAKDRVYTVVGKYERFGYTIEDYSSPAYTALTRGDDGYDHELFFTVKNPVEYYDFADKCGVEHRDHTALIRLYGLFRSGNIMKTLYGFMAILIMLIALGSISLIYNSFSISVSERVRQFGILKSIGATRAQIRRTVISEAAILSLIGIPIGAFCGCVGIGVTFYFLRDAFSFMAGEQTNEKMMLVLTPTGLIAAALLCFAIVLISAYIPARRAIKISPISAVRQSGDIVIKGRALRTSPITKKLFGFEGTMASKNFKRNKKRYRSTVASLFLSVTLFISASSLCSYLTKATDNAYDNDAKYDISYYTYGSLEETTDRDELLLGLSSLDGINDAVYLCDKYVSIYIDESSADPTLFRIYKANGGKVNVPVVVIFLDDSNFRELCKENGFDSDDFFDKENPAALIQNEANIIKTDGENDSKLVSIKLVGSKKYPCTLSTEVLREIEGYEFDTVVTEGDTEYAIYLPDSEVGETIKIPMDDAMVDTEHNIVGALSKLPFFCSKNNPAIIYPYSMIDEIDVGVLTTETNYYLKADSHAKAKIDVKNYLEKMGHQTSHVYDQAANVESTRMMVTVIKVFSYGFIVLISLIAASNVFNTVSTNILLRRREFAMLRSVGMTEGAISKMMNYECLIYGIKGLALGLPASFVVTFLIWRATDGGFEVSFYIPWAPVAIAIGSVFAVVFSSMLYAMSLIKKDNPIDALKNENQ